MFITYDTRTQSTIKSIQYKGRHDPLGYTSRNGIWYITEVKNIDDDGIDISSIHGTLWPSLCN